MRRALLIAALALAGCPEPAGEPAGEPDVQRECERIGDRCTLPDGPIGICNTAGGDCEAPPCLECMPQH